MQFDDRTESPGAFSHRQDYMSINIPGISGAHALLRRVLTEGPSAAEEYLSFLSSAGSSVYPLEALNIAELICPRRGRWSRRSRCSGKWWTGWKS